MKKHIKIFVIAVVAIIAVGYIIPECKAMPCGTTADYNHKSFWYWPWTGGKNGPPHAGVDIFGKIGTPVCSQTGGIVLYAQEMTGKVGNSVFVLGPKWRIHRYLHLNTITTKPFSFVKPGEQIATLGKTGNAANTPAHVHYGIVTPIPYIWRLWAKGGSCNPPKRFNWMLMFFLNPNDHLK